MLIFHSFLYVYQRVLLTPLFFLLEAVVFLEAPLGGSFFESHGKCLVELDSPRFVALKVKIFKLTAWTVHF
jgi:hypothetical protein